MRAAAQHPPCAFLRYNGTVAYAPSTSHDARRLRRAFERISTMALRAPEGTRDLLPDEQRFWTHVKQTAADIFGRYGYQPIETPLFEQT